MQIQAACRYVVEVRASIERIPQIRRILAAHLRYWRLESHIVPVCRAVDELIGNVVRHVPGDKTCVVELRRTGRRLTVSVADSGRALPRLTSSCPPRGGLAAVALLSDSWGTCATATGKVIWFSRRVKRAERTPLTSPAPGSPAPETRPLPAAVPARQGPGTAPGALSGAL
ncbi:ATP-binding protein [Streptomyces sp. NPDC001889]